MGLPQDEADADSVKWLKRAAELGHADAQHGKAVQVGSIKTSVESAYGFSA
jgi:TPR repeat protein